MMLLAFVLKAQTGILDISFGDPWPKADSLLAEYDFYTKLVEGPVAKYYAKHKDPMIEAVILFIEPVNYTVVGWFVKHWKTLSSEEDNMVADRLYEMHGEAAHYDKATEQIIWKLDDTHSIHLLYVSDESLCVFYQDSKYQDLFQLRNPKLSPGEEGDTEHEDK